MLEANSKKGKTRKALSDQDLLELYSDQGQPQQQQEVQPGSSTTPLMECWNTLVCNLSVLSQKARTCHWIVVGQNFFDLHDLFGKIYEQTADDIDTCAEKVRMLGGNPTGSFNDFLENTEINDGINAGNVLTGSKKGDFSHSEKDDLSMVQELLVDFETILKLFEAVIQCEGVERHSCFISDTMSGFYIKTSWFMKSFLGQQQE